MEFRIEKKCAFGDFKNWEEYTVENAPDNDSFNAIDTALQNKNPSLLVDGKPAEELNYKSFFRTSTDAAEFETQCLSSALDAVDENAKSFIIAGINGEYVVGYWNWLASQITE